MILPPPDITPDVPGNARLDSEPDAPLHSQVQQLLRGAITQHFGDAQSFWSELLSMERPGVSRDTVRKAFN